MTSSLTSVELSPEWFVRPNGSNGAEGIHGLGHTRRVLIHALEIADALEASGEEVLDDCERQAIRLAALWHDIGRTHDGVDYYHGAKSAGKVAGLGLHLGVDSAVRDLALFAITHHCGSEEHAEWGAHWMPDTQATLKVFRVLKDADALDRVRLGPHGDLDPSFLRFEVSRGRVERAWELLGEVR